VLKGLAQHGTGEQRVPHVLAIVATEENGQLLHVRRVHSR